MMNSCSIRSAIAIRSSARSRRSIPSSVSDILKLWQANMKDGNVDIDSIEAISFDPYTHGYYKVSGRVGDAFKDGLKLVADDSESGRQR